MPSLTQTVKAHQQLELTVPPSDKPQKIYVSAWKDRRRNIQVNVSHNGIDVSKPLNVEERKAARRGEHEFDVLDDTTPNL